MSSVSASSFSNRLSLPFAIALALNGTLAFGATLSVAGAEGRSAQSAGAPSDNIVAEDAAVVAPQAFPERKNSPKGNGENRNPHRAKATEKPTHPGRASSAQMVFIDPETGEFTSSPPPDAQMVLDLPDPALSTSDEGLEVVTHPDGSMSIDLQGRFQSRVFATMDDTGKITVSHQPSTDPRAAPASSDSDPSKPQ